MRNIGIEYPERGKMRFYDLGNPPDLSDSQILIRTHYSGITNGTERHALLGEHYWSGESSFPGRHGYQHVGQIEAVGSGVRNFQQGDIVFCGQYIGHRGWLVVEDSALCVRLPAASDFKRYALLGVAGVAMRGIRRFRVAPHQKVWVAGAGLIGQFVAQCARAVGAQVTVSDVDERRLAVSRELGAAKVINAASDGAAHLLKEGGPYECIIDACGVESLFIDIYKNGLLAKGGVVGALAVRSEARFMWPMLHGLEASIEGSCHFDKDDLAALVEFIQQGAVRVEPLVTHLVPIDEAPKIYTTLRDRPAELLGVIFDWTS